MLASTVQFSKNNQKPLRHCVMPTNLDGRRFIRGKSPITERHTKACSLRTQQRTDLFTQPPDDLSTQASLQYSLIRQPDV